MAREMTIPPETLDLARRLLAYEAVAGKPSKPTEPALALVYEKLRYSLCALVGTAGFRSLASRALTLARREAADLSAVQVTADGFLEGLGETEPRANKDEAGQEGVILIAQLLGLLCTFIGIALTLRLVQDLWPHEVPAVQSWDRAETERDEHTR
jgi:hypothetical protein